MTTHHSVKEIASRLHNAGTKGATISTVPGSNVPTSGYAVSAGNYGMVSRGVPRYDVLERWVASVLPHAIGPGRYVGTWEENGKVYYDVVDIHSEKLKAMLQARKLGEIAVWDIAAKDEIRTKDWFDANPTDALSRPWTHYGYDKPRG